MSADIYKNIAQAIILQQEVIVGDIAWREAQKVEGIFLTGKTVVSLKGNAVTVLDHLVTQYERLFGRASVEVCRNATHQFSEKLKTVELPKVLE